MTGDPVYTATGIVVAGKSAGVEISNGVTVGHLATQDLANNTKYFWQVQAKNSTGDGQWSALSDFTTIVALPAKVTLSSPANGAEDVSRSPALTWNEVEGAVTYEFEMDTSEAFDENSRAYVRVPEATVTTLNFVDYPGSTTYFWRVRARNAAGLGEWSAPWSFTTESALPAVITLSAPTNLSTVLTLRPTFKWEPDALAKTYTLQISTSKEFATLADEVTGIAGTEYEYTKDLEYSTIYFWRVAGVNDTGSGDYNTAFSFTTFDAPVPIQPTIFYPVKGEKDIPLVLTFDWLDLGEGVTYDFELAKTDQYSEPIVALTDLSVTEYKNTVILDPLTTYFWRVRGKNEFGYGEWNDFFEFKTLNPTAPGLVRDIRVRQITTKQVVSKTHTVQSTASFEVSWTPPEFDGGTPIVNYQILYRKAEETTWTAYEREASTDTVAIVTGFESGGSYAFDVLAQNAVGASEPNEEPPVVVSIETEEIPDQVTLMQNYPNPFNPATTIRFSLPVSSEVRLEVYSMLGQRLAVLAQGQQPAGWHTVTLDATSWASGTYIYRLQADGFTQTKKFLLVK